MSRLPLHIHCVQRVIVLESLIPLHLVHSTEQQLLRYGESYCHVNRDHCLLSKLLDDVFKCKKIWLCHLSSMYIHHWTLAVSYLFLLEQSKANYHPGL